MNVSSLHPFTAGRSAGPALSVCIVGAGFRGLGVLERIVAYGRMYRPRRTIRVHLVEPSLGGPEQYDPRQPDYLLLNIVCGQVSLFPDAASVGTCPPTPGPNLHEWVVQRDLRLDNDGFSVGRRGRPIEFGDFLPRRLLGEYLAWFRELLKAYAAPHVEIVEHRAFAEDLACSDPLGIALSNGTTIVADYLFLTVGQLPELEVEREASCRRIVKPYPLPGQLESVAAEDIVAIAGFGLSAVDAILTLTFGRGGRMETRNGREWYVPSGREPRIVAFSRSGLPYRSRPALGAPLRYEALAFTPPNIDRLRTERKPRLDYDRDVLPLLSTELRVAYWRARHGRDFGWSSATFFVEELRAALAAGHLEHDLAALDARHGAFDPRAAYFGSLPADDEKRVLENAATYQEWCQRWLEDDLREARLGVAHSPMKAALEACREFRDVIRHAVDFGGLTDESADRFFSFHAETLNRIGVGPQKERTANMLALMRAGVLSAPLGPNPTVAWEPSRRQWRLESTSLRRRHEVFTDWLYYGVTSRLRSLTDDSGIIGAMARRGILRQFRPDSSVIHAVDVDRSFHPISRDADVDSRIWVLGLLCEGVTFYNGYVTSPGKFVRSQHDADRAVGEIFSGLRRDDHDIDDEERQHA